MHACVTEKLIAISFRFIFHFFFYFVFFFFVLLNQLAGQPLKFQRVKHGKRKIASLDVNFFFIKKKQIHQLLHNKYALESTWYESLKNYFKFSFTLFQVQDLCASVPSPPSYTPDLI